MIRTVQTSSLAKIDQTFNDMSRTYGNKSARMKLPCWKPRDGENLQAEIWVKVRNSGCPGKEKQARFHGSQAPRNEVYRLIAENKTSPQSLLGDTFPGLIAS